MLTNDQNKRVLHYCYYFIVTQMYVGSKQIPAVTLISDRMITSSATLGVTRLTMRNVTYAGK